MGQYGIVTARLPNSLEVFSVWISADSLGVLSILSPVKLGNVATAIVENDGLPTVVDCIARRLRYLGYAIITTATQDAKGRKETTEHDF